MSAQTRDFLKIEITTPGWDAKEWCFLNDVKTTTSITFNDLDGFITWERIIDNVFPHIFKDYTIKRADFLKYIDDHVEWLND